MTSKIYRSAMGKTVDLGTIMLQNEHVRAVGNMKVNARGDKLDNANQIVETRSERIQQQNNKTSTNVSNTPVHTSSRKGRANKSKTVVEEPVVEEPVVMAAVVVEEPVVLAPAPVPPVVVSPPPAPKTTLNTVAPKAPPKPLQVDLRSPVTPPKSPAVDNASSAQGGGLAGAIARSREIKQDLDRTRRQKAQDSGVRKI